MRKHPRVSKTFNQSLGMTKKSFQKECDINEIMARFQKKGIIDHYAKHGPEYMDIPEIEYQDALNIVIRAQNTFDDLPATIRKKFNNDPSEFLSFVQDEENIEEMRELGLAKPKEKPNPLLRTKDLETTPRETTPVSTEPKTTPPEKVES